MSRPRALVLRALGVGDLLAGVPALRALRRALPGHETVLAAPEPLRPLVALTGAVDRLLPTGELEPVPWTGAAPDVAVDLHGCGPESHRLLLALEPRRLVGFGCARLQHDGPQWRDAEHERARWVRLVTESFDLPSVAGQSDDVRIEVPDEPPLCAGAVVVHPGAASASRRWPAERFAAVAAWLRDATGSPVLVTGSAGERPVAEEVRRSAGLAASSVVAGATDLRTLAATVARARLVVSGDTGVAHLASAYGVPSVVLFGPTPPSSWGPPASGPHTVLWHGAAGRPRGDPHGDVLDPTLARVSVDEVVAAAALRLRSADRAPVRRTSPASA